MIASLASRVLGRILGLPPAVTGNIEVRRDLRIPMPDGVELLADLYLPRNVPNAPTILVRTPYGRREGAGIAQGRLPAEYGFQVLLQSCRGTAGSGGTFTPFVDERTDGLATIDWIERQPWYNGRLLGLGGSYTGNVQWAIAAEAGDRFTAIAPHLTASQFRDSIYAGDGFALHASLLWTTAMARASGRLLPDLWGDITSMFRIGSALNHLPLGEADLQLADAPVPSFRRWLQGGDPKDWPRPDVASVTTPAVMVGGWQDIFLPWQLDDYRRLRSAGRRPYLTIGPWTHGSVGAGAMAMHEALTWFRAHVTGTLDDLRKRPVRLYVQGAEEWREFDDWPVPATPQSWRLQPGGGLSTDPPPAGAAPSRFRYDPADPTPSLGGPLLTRDAGRYDNRPLEERPDVLVFTSRALTRPLEVIGPVTARIRLRSSVPHADLFIRLCDVDASGRSANVCDGLQRVTPDHGRADQGPIDVDVRLWPTAYRFAPGHRLRVQVSGGAHPRYARNLGTGESMATATRMVAADHEIFHDPARPSAITLPVPP